MAPADDTDKDLVESASFLNPRSRVLDYAEKLAQIESKIESMLADRRLSGEVAFRLLHHFLYVMGRLTISRQLAGYCLRFSDSDFITEIHKLLSRNPVTTADMVRAVYCLKSVHYDAQRWPGETVLPELLATLPLDRLSRVLDLGCGTGRAGAMLRRAGFDGRLVGVDLSVPMLKAARIKGDYQDLIEADLVDWLEGARTPGVEGRFDLVIMFWATCHLDLDQVRRMVAGVGAVMADTGLFLVDTNLIAAGVPQPGDRIFSNAQFELVLRRGGFVFRSRDGDGNRFYVCTRRGAHQAALWRLPTHG